MLLVGIKPSGKPFRKGCALDKMNMWMNALLSALYNGVSVKDATIYVWGLPVCAECTKSVIQSGIKRVVITRPELAPEKWQLQWKEMSKPMYDEAGVSVSYLNHEHWNFDNE